MAMSTDEMESKRSNYEPVGIQQLTDHALEQRLTELLGDDRRLEVDLLAHISEVDRRKLYRERGYSSMFSFCVEKLHLAESVAYKRITVARAAHKYPSILEKIAQGGIHLTGASQLAPYCTPNNVDELLAAATHKSKREIAKLLAETFPQPDVPARIRKLPNNSRTKGSPAPSTLATTTSSPSSSSRAPTDEGSLSVRLLPEQQASKGIPSRVEPSSAGRRDRIAPLSADRFKIQFTADATLTDKIREAQELLGPQIAQGDLAALFTKALDVLVADLKNKKHGVTTRARIPRDPSMEREANSVSRTIPRAVRRQVYERDGGQCAYVSSDGKRCAERWGLEYHHRQAYGLGGKATVDNLELRCKCHNGLAAEQDYGVEKMAQYMGSAREPDDDNPKGSRDRSRCCEQPAPYHLHTISREPGVLPGLDPERVFLARAPHEGTSAPLGWSEAGAATPTV